MMDVVWDGITRVETLHAGAANARLALADAAQDTNWPRVWALLAAHPACVNTCRPGDHTLDASLHHAAHAGAPVDVVQRLIGLGAWRTLQNARGERPVDVAARRGQRRLLDVLEPVYTHRVPLGVLLKIQAHFHGVIRERADWLVHEHALRLPELEPLLELEQPQMWFAVPGMYGGFRYRLEAAGVEAKLVSTSWCRGVGGSGQRYEITSEGSRLVAEGFV